LVAGTPFESLIAEVLENAPVPEDAPAHGHIFADSQGFLWIERARHLGDVDAWYTIVDGDGQLYGRVRAPGDLRLHQIGDDWLIGRRVSIDTGVESVAIYELARR